MDSRAAKGIAANIRKIAESTAMVVLIDARVGTSGDEFQMAEARVEYTQDIEKAEKSIAQWLMQPMTTR